jgi:hypothetical protein
MKRETQATNGFFYTGSTPRSRQIGRSMKARYLAKTACLGVALATLGLGLSAPRTLAQSQSQPVPIDATVLGSNTPTLDCSWILPDPPTLRASSSTWADRMQNYQTGQPETVGAAAAEAGAVGNDDQPELKPLVAPCKTPNLGVDGSRPTQTDRTSRTETTPIHVQITPNINDQPQQRYVELWAAVGSTLPISAAAQPNPQTVVFWNVFYPDGTLMAKIKGTNYTPGLVDGPLCAGPKGMFAMAAATGQIESSTVSNDTPLIHDSIADYCNKNKQDLYYGAFAVSIHQPYGVYRVEAVTNSEAFPPGVAPSAELPSTTQTSITQTSTTQASTTQPSTTQTTTTLTGTAALSATQSVQHSYFEVLPVVSVGRDFTSVGFDAVVAGKEFTIVGDTEFGSGGPTIQSQGNAGVTVEIAFSNLCLLVSSVRTCDFGQRVTEFGGGFGTSEGVIEKRSQISGLDNTTLGEPVEGFQGFFPAEPAPGGARYQTLCPSDLGKIDFTTTTPSELAGGEYVGKIHLKYVAVATCPTDLGHPYGVNVDPNVKADTTFDGTVLTEVGYL